MTMDIENFDKRIARTFEASISTKEKLLNDTATIQVIGKVAAEMIKCFRDGKKVFLFGNGGSAADAQHIAAEFVGRFAFNRPALPALALSVNSSCVTAIGNDYGFDLVFSRQIEALAQAGDVAIGISTSGNSANVLCGLRAAKERGLVTVGMTSLSGGKLKTAADYCISAPSNETPRIQECHILIGHVISELVEEAIFPEQAAASKK